MFGKISNLIKYINYPKNKTKTIFNNKNLFYYYLNQESKTKKYNKFNAYYFNTYN